jgi:hypothetical protein
VRGCAELVEYRIVGLRAQTFKLQTSSQKQLPLHSPNGDTKTNQPTTFALHSGTI